MKKRYKSRCQTCGNVLQKRGKTAAGTQRYYCVNCSVSSTSKKPYLTKQSELKKFIDWILSKKTREQSSKDSRQTFWFKTRWCWDIVPAIDSKNISSKYIIVDTTYLEADVALMIVRNEQYVLNYRWCETENFDDYYELLKTIKEPGFLICDGHSGLMKAARKLWKTIGIQRCLFHVGLNAKAKLGKRSPHPEVHILREHILKISAVNTIRKSKNWLKKFERLCDEFQPFLDEKAYSVDPDTGEVLKEFRRNQKPYSMTNMIRRVHKKNQLFLYLEHHIPNTTNFVEGGLNARIKELVRCHRGLDIGKRKRVCEWYLLSRSAENIGDLIRRFSGDS